ncbi:hypothetical protein GWP85_16175 [Acinetobacter beijerinckii]|uniref:hypothetical protein n=1 Tax=Acinetobacter TaxID=469 RepID=UPI0020C98000|nr:MULTISPECIES: hypothetical protein [Acinetobacter]MDF2419028.1 hypothetical protein [Acinetobacter beijerinckii]UTO19514.1 hypothetical protein NGC85_16750 [Acinetobacter sp. Z1]
MKTDPIITKIKFRLMLISSLVFGIIGSIFDAYDERSIWINEALSIDPQNWELVITCILLIGLFAGLIGLFTFKEWARKLYVYSFFPLLLIYLLPSFSWTFMSGFGAIFYELGGILTTLLWGILIVPSLYQHLFQKSIK